MHTPSSADGQVVVGYDGSAASQRALVWAAAVSRALGDGLKIVHAVDLDVVPQTPRLRAATVEPVARDGGRDDGRRSVDVARSPTGSIAGPGGSCLRWCRWASWSTSR